MSNSSTYLCSLFTVVKHWISTSVFHIAFFIIKLQNLQVCIISRSSMMQQSPEATTIEVVVIFNGRVGENYLLQYMSSYVLFIESFRHNYPNVNAVAKH